MKKCSTTRCIISSVALILLGGLGYHFLSCDQAYEPKEEKVKNIIFMIGDGMGVAQVSATQIAQDYEPMEMERATYVGLQKTYSANSRVTDSAAAGTALSTGYKTNNGMVGMSPDSLPQTTILEHFEQAGLPTGIVVTYPVTNATPATFVSHVPNRHWEDEIAEYYIKNEVDVIFGGGSQRFDKRADGVNLFDALKEKNYTVAYDLSEIEDVKSGNVIMLPTEGSMSSRLDGRDEYLPEATAKALEILTNNAAGEGFFLMVESSMIDGYGHQNNVEGIIKETKDFDNAVKVAFDYADTHPGTLVVVTADHATGGLTIVNGNRRFDLHDHQVDYAFTTGGHTGEMVPIFAYGAGAENFTGVLENTELPQIMRRLMDFE